MATSLAASFDVRECQIKDAHSLGIPVVELELLSDAQLVVNGELATLRLAVMIAERSPQPP